MKITCRRSIALVVFLLTAVTLTSAQSAAPADRWGAVRFLIGSWEGVSEGRPGNGTSRRQYQLVLRDQLLEVRNTATYPAQEKNPKGEVHEDLGFISVDRGRKRLVFRQFHVEGFIIQYVQDETPAHGVLSFTSEAIDNIPAGWRARESYVQHGPDEFEEIFELAAAGKPFEVYSRTRLKRIK